MVKKVDINLPDLDETAHTMIGKGKILFVSIHHDQDASNPLDDDGVGHIYSLNRRHNNQPKDQDHFQQLLDDPDHVRLSYFEHGNCCWMVAGGDKAKFGGDWKWDGVGFAGIWVPDDSTRESYPDQGKDTTAQARQVMDVLSKGKDRAEWMKEQAASACEVYTQYCNGEVYGYTVALYKARYRNRRSTVGPRMLLDDLDDYRHDEAIGEDSCWGFFGWDYVKQETLAAAEQLLK